jgi:hypothetical protein
LRMERRCRRGRERGERIVESHFPSWQQDCILLSSGLRFGKLKTRRHAEAYFNPGLRSIAPRRLWRTLLKRSHFSVRRFGRWAGQTTWHPLPGWNHQAVRGSGAGLGQTPWTALFARPHFFVRCCGARLSHTSRGAVAHQHKGFVGRSRSGFENASRVTSLGQSFLVARLGSRVVGAHNVLQLGAFGRRHTVLRRRRGWA